MKKYLLIAFFISFSSYLFPQSAASYRADLEKLLSTIKALPSFKDQIRNDKAKAYQALYDSLVRDTAGILPEYESFCKLAKLFFPIRDNHLGFYQLPEKVLAPAQFQDSAAVKAYRSHSAFLNYPKTTLDIETLEQALRLKPIDSVEGVYYYDKYLTVGLYRSGPGAYVGIVLSTTLPNWERGQVAIWLNEYQPGNFNAIYAHPVYKNLILYINEKFRDQSLINARFYASLTESVYTKQVDEVDYENIPGGTPDFLLNQCNSSIQYLRIGHFSVGKMKEAVAFANRINDSLTALHLIVDLRNNTGGADKVSKPFLKLLKRYAKHGNVHVLVNAHTISQGEIFTLQLKKLPNTTVYGTTTRGMLAYGSNYGKTVKLPSGKFQVYITDMRNGRQLLPYESVGVHPDVALQTDSDWIQQVVRVIESNQ